MYKRKHNRIIIDCYFPINSIILSDILVIFYPMQAVERKYLVESFREDFSRLDVIDDIDVFER